MIVQAGTVSKRGRGELPSFNLLRIQRPEIGLVKYEWDPATRVFASAAAGHYRHTSAGWITEA